MGQAISFQGDTDFGTTFLWSFGDGATATTQSASHAFSAVGTYTVSFKASANGYLASTTTVTVTVIAKPSLTSFTASPASISSGQSSTLAWAVTGATSLSLDNGIGDVTGTTSHSVTLAVSTTYTLTATNAAGSVTATVTVAVSAPAPPTITSFTASPAIIAVGHSTTLAWSVTGGASVSISSLGTQGGTSVAVTPANTTTYTLTATNAAGTATAMITVTVETELPRIADFWADPYQVASGQSTTLHWATGLADAVKLNGSTVSGASASVAPTSTTTYTLTATNLIGSVSATLTVSVGTPGTLVWTKTIVYGFGQELAEDQPGMGTTFIQSDFVGSPSFMTDASGAVIGRSKNLPFGERMSSWGQKTIRRYTNHEDDADSNAIYMQAREQLPAYGKFAQVDPAYDQTKDDPESWNLYTYVTNNPVTHTDPDGRVLQAPMDHSSASIHPFDFDSDTFEGDYNWAAMEAGGGSSGGGKSKSNEAKEATEPPPTSTTETGTGDQGDTGKDKGDTGTKPSKPKEATTPKVETKPAQTKKEAAKEKRLEKWQKKYKKLSDKQVTNIVFNETRSLDGDKAHEARVDVAAAVINGDNKAFEDGPGHARPQTASDKASVPKAEQSTYDDSEAAVSEARGKLAGGQDPTSGATHFNLRNGDSRKPFQGHDLHTQSGPFDNSFPTNALKGENIYVNTYE